ncbi:hypothetical protein BDN72DRAFT_848068 [Pluteus cervinus]|uniref:Uncharacterized protein n=1 Tax=Pluteus cervinus TaxID=181527 RepID=A0ACD3ABG7_9AGAR|nr:hypothetical protein BDN72DRAFT_848068 [Pluteus cervinus]
MKSPAARALREQLGLGDEAPQFKALRKRINRSILIHMNVSPDAPIARFQAAGLEAAMQTAGLLPLCPFLVFEDEQIKHFFPLNRRISDERIIRDYLMYRTNAMRTETRRPTRNQVQGIAAPMHQSGGTTTTEMDSDMAPPPQFENGTLQEQTQEVTNINPNLEATEPSPSFQTSFSPTYNTLNDRHIEPPTEQSPQASASPPGPTFQTDELFDFLTQTCVPSLRHLHQDLIRVGCQMQHLRAMSKWSQKLRDDVLERLRLKILELDSGAQAGNGNVTDDNDDEESMRRQRVEHWAVQTAGGEVYSRGSVMDWEVLRYHIIKLADSGRA